MKNNETLQGEVQDAIKWEPLLNAAKIGVTAKNGVITLTGVVDRYIKKIEAVIAAKNVAGVKAVDENSDIKFAGIDKKLDSEIATPGVDSIDNQLDIQYINQFVDSYGYYNFNIS